MDEYVFALQIAVVVFVFYASIFFPAICTLRVWRAEKRLVIFAIDSDEKQSDFEKECWKNCHKLSKCSMVAAFIFVITIVYDVLTQ